MDPETVDRGENELVAPSMQDEGVQVDLDQETSSTATPSKPAAEKATPDPEVTKQLKALQNQTAAQRRIIENYQRELAQRRTAPSTPAPAAPTLQPGAAAMPAGTAQETVDKYDQLVNDGRWQEAVRLLAEEQANKVVQSTLQQREQAEQQRDAQATRLTVWEQSKQRVRERYPALDEVSGDMQAPESQYFNLAVAQLQREDPTVLQNPRLPELAMHRMEDLAREQGVRIQPAATGGSGNSAAQPAVRRTGPTSLPASRRVGGANTMTLSKDQKEWCDRYLGHLPESERYKQYAMTSRVMEQGGDING